MALKQQLKSRWNGDKQHKDGLNTNRAYSSHCKTTVFEIQAMDMHTSSPKNLQKYYKNKLEVFYQNQALKQM